MPTVFDVAKYIFQQRGSTTAMKLQKLVYYCQAWSLCWDEAPLFNEKIEAWANGPVVRELFYEFQGQYLVSDCQKGNVDSLTIDQKETIDKVLEFYGDKSPQWLSDLTHSEKPWKDARIGLSDGALSDREITLASMEMYYSSLPPK
jgi:uncharacterized phage-associated protein